MLPLMAVSMEVHGSEILVRGTCCPGAARNRDGRHHPSGRGACGEWMPVVEHLDGLTRRKTGGAPVTHTAHRRTREVSVVSIEGIWESIKQSNWVLHASTQEPGTLPCPETKHPTNSKDPPLGAAHGSGRVTGP